MIVSVFISLTKENSNDSDFRIPNAKLSAYGGNKVCLANAIKNPLGSQLRAYRLAIKFPFGNALKHPLGAQASLHCVSLTKNM